MATRAMHKMGDISRKDPDLCLVFGEDGENWVGNWSSGMGFMYVRFPKHTTRQLTPEEKKQYGFSVRPAVIVLPKDEERKQRLTRKREEYRHRLDNPDFSGYKNEMLCRIEVLDRLLADGRAVTKDILNKLVKQYGSEVNLDDFDSSCVIIEDYCETGGAKVRGGTGLH
ncbi:MAG: hypothetical protein Q8P76_03690 [bacterium]|nr:hypothetical protein [bacterium]